MQEFFIYLFIFLKENDDAWNFPQVITDCILRSVQTETTKLDKQSAKHSQLQTKLAGTLIRKQVCPRRIPSFLKCGIQN